MFNLVVFQMVCIIYPNRKFYFSEHEYGNNLQYFAAIQADQDLVCF